MNAQQFLLALEQTGDAYVQQAGLAGGHFASNKAGKAGRIVQRVLLAAAVVLALSATVFAVGPLIGIWNDQWLHTPAPDPEAVVREAIERQTEKDYTVSVTVEVISVDETETQKILAGAPDSMLAMTGGFDETAQALAEKQPGEVVAIYARYTVVYDHEKTFYPDGTMYQYFYLVLDARGNWEILDSSDALALALTPVEEAQPDSSAVTLPELPFERDYSAAIEVVTAMVRQWEAFDDVERITVDSAEFDPAQTDAALAYLCQTEYAARNGWTEDFLRNHMAAITVTYTVWYEPDPQLPAGSSVTETATYWLLEDPSTGEWHNSDITGFMDGSA